MLWSYMCVLSPGVVLFVVAFLLWCCISLILGVLFVVVCIYVVLVLSPCCC